MASRSPNGYFMVAYIVRLGVVEPEFCRGCGSIMRVTSYFSLALSVAVVGAVASVPAMAQDQGNPGGTFGGSANPGLIIQHTQDPTSTHTQPKPETDKPPEPELNAPPQTGQPVDPSLKKTFRIDQINVQGATKIDQGKIDELVSQYEGRDVSFLDLKDLADKLTKLYRDEGYMTTLVYIPPQRIENKTVTLTASEGIVGEIEYEPDNFWPERAVMPRISLDNGEVFNAETLRRELRRINDNPDLKVRASLEAGKKENETDIHLKADGQQPFHITAFVDNLGRPVIGRTRAGITTSLNNVTGIGDRAYNSLSWTARSFGSVSHYQAPVGPHGTTLNFDHAYSTLSLGFPFRESDITGKAYIYSAYVNQELWNTENARVSLDLGMDFKDIKTDSEPGNAFDPNIGGGRQAFHFRDRVRPIRAALNTDTFDKFGRTIMRHEVALGLDWLGASGGGDPADSSDGASNQVSRKGATGKFFRYTGSVTRVQKMPWNSFAIIRATGQASPDRLLSVEQFQGGGAFTVRGYLEGQSIGDNGIIGSAEWRIPAYIFPKTWKLPHTNYTLRDNIQLVTFIDYGAFFVNKSGRSQHRQVLMGTGVGVRVNLTRFLAGRLDLGIPLANVPDNQYPRIHFGIESRLF